MSWFWSYVWLPHAQMSACGGIVVTPFERMRTSQPVANAPDSAFGPIVSFHEPFDCCAPTRYEARPWFGLFWLL